MTLDMTDVPVCVSIPPRGRERNAHVPVRGRCTTLARARYRMRADERLRGTPEEGSDHFLGDGGSGACTLLASATPTMPFDTVDAAPRAGHADGLIRPADGPVRSGNALQAIAVDCVCFGVASIRAAFAGRTHV